MPSPRVLCSILAWIALALPAPAQELCPCPPPPPPEPHWKGSLGAGLAVTSGNSDTSSYNLNFVAAYDPKARNVFKADGLYLKTATDGLATADKTALGVRDEYRLGAHAFVFGEARYLRDPMKEIRYLVSPVAGFGYKLVDRDDVRLSLDGALGFQFQGLLGQPATTDGALQAGQALAFKLSATTTLLQRAQGLWKLEDFGDALYRLEASLAVSISKRFELKLADYLDYKTRPASPGLGKSDNSLVVALVLKIG